MGGRGCTLFGYNRPRRLAGLRPVSAAGARYPAARYLFCAAPLGVGALVSLLVWLPVQLVHGA